MHRLGLVELKGPEDFIHVDRFLAVDNRTSDLNNVVCLDVFSTNDNLDTKQVKRGYVINHASKIEPKTNYGFDISPLSEIFGSLLIPSNMKNSLSIYLIH